MSVKSPTRSRHRLSQPPTPSQGRIVGEQVFRPRLDSLRASDEDFQDGDRSIPPLLQPFQEAVPTESGQSRQARRWSSINASPAQERCALYFPPSKLDSDAQASSKACAAPRNHPLEPQSPGVRFAERDSIKYLSIISASSSRDASPPDIERDPLPPIPDPSTTSKKIKSSGIEEKKEDKQSLAKRFKSGLANLKEDQQKIEARRAAIRRAQKNEKAIRSPTDAMKSLPSPRLPKSPVTPSEASSLKSHKLKRPGMNRTQSAETTPTGKRVRPPANPSQNRSSHPPSKSKAAARDVAGSEQPSLPASQRDSGHFEGSSTSSLNSLSTRSRASDQTARSSVESTLSITEKPVKAEKKPIKSILKNKGDISDYSNNSTSSLSDGLPVVVNYPQIHPPSPSPISPGASPSLPIFSNSNWSKPVDPRNPPPRPARPPAPLDLSNIPTIKEPESPVTPSATSPASKRRRRAPVLTVIREIATPVSESFPSTPPALSGPLSSSTVDSLPPPETPPPARPLPQLPVHRRSSSLPKERQSRHKRQHSAPQAAQSQSKPEKSKKHRSLSAKHPSSPNLRSSSKRSPRVPQGHIPPNDSPRMAASAITSPTRVRQDAIDSIKDLDWSSYQTAIGGPTGGLLMSGDIAPHTVHPSQRTRSYSHSQAVRRTTPKVVDPADDSSAAWSGTDSCVEDDLIEWFHSFGFAHAGRKREGERQYKVGAAGSPDEDLAREVYWQQQDEVDARNARVMATKIAAAQAAESGTAGLGVQDSPRLNAGGAGRPSDALGSPCVSSIIPPGRASPELGVWEKDWEKAEAERKWREAEAEIRRAEQEGLGLPRIMDRKRPSKRGKKLEGVKMRVGRMAVDDASPELEEEKRGSAAVVMEANLSNAGPMDWEFL